MKKYFFQLKMIWKRFLFLMKHVLLRFKKPRFSFPEIEFTKIPFHFDYRKFFKKETIALDFGSGNGKFGYKYAKEHPETQVITVEIFRRYHKEAVERADRLKAKNMACIRGDGKEIIRTLTKKEGFDRIFINFPDPWHKKKHHKRRVFTECFFQKVLYVLSNGGMIHFITDNEGIFEFAYKNAQNFLKNNREVLVEKMDIPEWYPESKYHRKWKNKGRNIQYFEMRKI